MKKLFSAILLCLSTLSGITQIDTASEAGMRVNFTKSKPAQIIHYERLYDPKNTGTARKKLDKKSDFTDAEINEIFSRLGIDSLLPKGMTRSDAYHANLQHYKCYEQSDFNLIGYNFSLVWVPYEENLHMPASWQPTSKHGFVFYTYTKNLSFNGKDSKGQDLAKAGSSVNENPVAKNTINVSTADMSQVEGRLGVMLIYYGSKTTNTFNSYSAWTLYGKGTSLKNQAAMADKLATRTAGAGDYIGYYFIGSGDCADAENYVMKKFNIPKNKIRFYGNCSPLTINNE